MLKAQPASGRASFAARLWAPLAALALAIAGCGSGGGDGQAPAAGGGGTPGSGTVYIGLTDADGDFLSYSVDVVSLTLQKANGTVVETLPVRSRVDFAELVDLTEFVTSATVPGGFYVAGTIRLDYSNAVVTVEVGGEPREAKVIGQDGRPLGVVDLEIRLDERNQLKIAPGRPAFLQLDFDLAASHSVDVTTTPVATTASPFIVASVQPMAERELRVRGPLKSVDTAAGTYTVDLRPFNLRDARLGELAVKTTADTAFEIDGQAYAGPEGLQALAATAAGTPTVAFGTLSVTERTFTAARIRAGGSVAGAQFDALRGNVIARSGDRLTVRGGTLIRRDDSVVFVRGDISVLVGADTRVLRDGQRGLLAANAVSVGQRIEALGQASEANGAVTLDAGQGLVRMQLTHVAGTVVSTQPGELTLDLAAIDGRLPGIFDFNGTGVSSDVDAEAAHYQVATGPLALGGLTAGQPAAAFGFVTPFGEAPPDFEGRTIVDIAALRAVLGLGWTLQGTAAPFTRLDGQGLVLNQANPDIGLRHHVRIGMRVLDLSQLASPVTVVPGAAAGLYAIGEPGRVEMFGDFARFAARLSEKLGAGEKARAMSASGRFDPDSFVLTAWQVSVSLNPPN
jgi:hypothetical protein